LDLQVLGGLWNLEGYQQEHERPSSRLLGLIAEPAALDPAGVVIPEAGSASQLLAMGCLWGILDEAHITVLAVDSHYHRQGFGQTVLYGLLMVARQMELARSTLEVRDSNQAALSLYQKFGFRTAGRRRGYYAPTGEDALILWRGELQTLAFERALNQWRTDIHQGLIEKGWPKLVISL
jgi:ribosomal-protein-alanine N-acetyltransferase